MPTSDQNTRIGQRVRAAREMAGLSQDELARVIGRTPSAISNYERGTRPLSAVDLARIAEATHQPPGFFFGEDSEVPAKEEILGIAFEQVRADRQYRFGDRTSDGYPPPIKHDIIRMYEKVTGKRLLPEGFEYP